MEASVEASVSEIHGYPLRPEGYAEPLFHSLESRKEILEHFARSSWLWRASEQAAPAPGQTGAPSGARAGRVVRVMSRWREVDRWWEPDGGVDAVWRLVELDRGGECVWAEPQREVRAA
ncbi:hypothetical protein [Rubrobacter aplysinae]|uniref:hypothetical protein n=1 Tax=Rubrobacter aplysinae TaxID=909625 RepID=UPI00064BFAF2|nr:hypothetical protein [Rubrobacter aplysinae]